MPRDARSPLGFRPDIADAGEPRRSSTFFHANEFAGCTVPEREWLVPDLVPRGTVTLLGGDGGTGKSLITLQLAAAVALGTPWLGRDVREGGALMLSAEDDRDELHRRLDAVAAAEGVGMMDLSRLTLRSVAGEDALLATLDHRGTLKDTGLFTELDERIGDERPELVALDTLSDLHAGNENDRAQARQFVGLLRGLAIRHQTAVVLLAHPSLSGLNSGSGTSGSTGWNNSVRSRLYLERVRQDDYEPDPDARVLRTMKANYGAVGGEIRMRWTRGVFVADAEESSLERMAGSMKSERVFLKLLRQFGEQGRRVNHAGGQTYAPRVFSAQPAAEGVSARLFRQAMEKLLAEGKVRIGEDGPPSKRRQFLEVAE